jgi:hypothetical protein
VKLSAMSSAAALQVCLQHILLISKAEQACEISVTNHIFCITEYQRPAISTLFNSSNSEIRHCVSTINSSTRRAIDHNMISVHTLCIVSFIRF